MIDIIKQQDIGGSVLDRRWASTGCNFKGMIAIAAHEHASGRSAAHMRVIALEITQRGYHTHTHTDTHSNTSVLHAALLSDLNGVNNHCFGGD